LEQRHIDAYLVYITTTLKDPVNQYKSFFDPIFELYSFQLVPQSGSLYNDLNKDINKNIELYQKEINKRYSILSTIKSNLSVSSVRFTEKNLKILLNEATVLVENYYEKLILKYLDKTKDNFLNDITVISEKNWRAFTTTILEEIFGVGVLTPLENHDDFFNLNVSYFNLKRKHYHEF
jgi:hypothetical protein